MDLVLFKPNDTCNRLYLLFHFKPGYLVFYVINIHTDFGTLNVLIVSGLCVCVCVFVCMRERGVVRNDINMMHLHSLSNRGQSHIKSIMVYICTVVLIVHPFKDYICLFIICIYNTVRNCWLNGNTEMWHLHHKLSCLNLLFTLLRCIFL